MHGIPLEPSLLRTGLPTIATGYRLVNELLALPKPPTALFLGNNLLTVGALKAIHERNLHIPEEIALVAFDEMEWMFVVKPALTVVAQPVYDMGKCAADLLLARIADPERPIEEIVLKATIHIRQSCADHAPWPASILARQPLATPVG
jgi:DNA-binding LacI/PurR family transcriptional regulator